MITSLKDSLPNNVRNFAGDITCAYPIYSDLYRHLVFDMEQSFSRILSLVNFTIRSKL